jgi:hypothetical protein
MENATDFITLLDSLTHEQREILKNQLDQSYKAGWADAMRDPSRFDIGFDTGYKEGYRDGKIDNGGSDGR